ncbi:transcription factor SPT20 homolog [Orycteropus afer afer]|uniref:Transcription factor SPT20 homolog n=1 Tax=Orycteropus afer afer TaxID=1230840 RepID=A0AC54Z7T6_ORYAF|nr:transcription factor SPT20 homolog [Orycteropus afer afer]
MEQALEAALECADDLIENAQQRPPTMECLSSERKSLFQKLHDLYVEECEKEPVDVQELRTNVNLLEKLVMRERLSHLVVSLYPGSEGYSLMFSGENKSESETIKLPYEEREFLEYLDAEELPPLLVEYLEKSQVNMFYSGCVIAEVRDYRQCSNTQSPGYQSRHVLLRPTMQTLAQDVHSITNEDSNWTEEDKLALESQLILATAEPLCLDPSVAVTCTANRLLYEKQKMNTHPMKQCFKRCFRSSLNQQPELSDDPPPSPLTPFTSCQERKKRKANQQHDLKISQAGNCVDMWKQSPCDLAMPSRVDVEKHTKMEKFVIPDDSRPIVWAACEKNDDDFLERGAGHQHWTASLAAMQSRDPVLSETIQPCEDDEENDIERSPFLFSIDDHPDLFITGPKAAAETVVSQNQDLVQKEAKCPERISHSSTGSASLSQRSLREEVEQPQTGLVPSSVLSKEVKHLLPPAKLPSSLETSSSVNLSTPQQGRSFLKSPTPSPASKPPVPCQKSSVDLSRVSTLSAAAPSPASSSQRPMVVANTATLKSIDAMGSGHGAEASVSGSKPTLACSPSAKTPAEVNPNGCVPSRVPVPAAVPDAVQAASEAGVSRKINMISFVGPLTLVHLPDGQFFLILQQQKQQRSKSTPQQPAQHLPADPQQPGGQGSAQGSTSQAQAFTIEQALLNNLPKLQHVVPAQTVVLPQLPSVQKKPQRSLPQQRVQIPTDIPQQKPHIQLLKTLQRPVFVTEADKEAGQPRCHQGTGSQSAVLTF